MEWLAHLLRDARYGVERGDIAFNAPFEWLLLRATALGRRRDTLKQYRADLDRRLDRIMGLSRSGSAALLIQPLPTPG